MSSHRSGAPGLPPTAAAGSVSTVAEEALAVAAEVGATTQYEERFAGGKPSDTDPRGRLFQKISDGITSFTDWLAHQRVDCSRFPQLCDTMEQQRQFMMMER